MDITDLDHLADRLEERGLQVLVCAAEQRLHVTNPLNERVFEEITATDTTYVTSFGYKIGERGRELDCADRIAQFLAVGTATA
ncbi:MAG TPA: hypothetical protein VIU15_16930 [Streptomyces sp.]